MLLWFFTFTLLTLTLVYLRINLLTWTCVTGVALATLSWVGTFTVATEIILWLVFFLVVIPINYLPLRQRYISRPLLEVLRKAMPSISDTEREALDAGNVWWDGELFSGRPDWEKLLNIPAPALTSDEHDFIEGPVEQLCAMIDDWDITHNKNDLPPEMWVFLKKNKFFGMIIPKSYGGLEFSALAHSTVIMKLASRSISVAVT
ncbi:MAG: acyl-CoA dehydrogenase family protein, partial [Gammaproteobacteria bacterium]|nr:acyl-CoA dehydrogenase family protein [Gammaproteobacteria bacterium]